MSRKPSSGAGPCRTCGRNHRTLSPEDCADRRMTEKTLQSRVVARARKRGWKVAHAGKGFVGGEGGQFATQMAKGWPDLFLLNEFQAPHRLAIELKRELSEPDEAQWEYLRLLNACGIPAVVVRPSDLRLGRVNAILEGR